MIKRTKTCSLSTIPLFRVNDHSPECPHFFILGSQRSGTTLLRLLLNNHSAVAIPNEASFLMPFLGKKELLDSGVLSDFRKQRILRYLMANSQFAKWKLQERELIQELKIHLTMRQLISLLYYLFASKHGKSICGDKSPTFIRKLGALSDGFPNAKFIHIVRDGRDTFLSLRRKNAPGTSSIALSALEWKFKILLIRRAIKKLKGRVIQVRYEDLVLEPKKELTTICTFLGIPFEKQMLDFWKKSENFIANHHSDLIFKPIDPSNICKWKKELSIADVRKYEYFAERTLISYEYDVPSSSFNIRERAVLWVEVIRYLPARMIRIIRIALFMRIASKVGLRVGTAYYD